MRSLFVQTENVTKFLSGVAAIENRVAPEAAFMLVTGDAGYGKSRVGLWWATQQGAVHVRAKAAGTPLWLLTDIVKELGQQSPAHSSAKLFQQAVSDLVRNPRPLVIDEVEATLSDIRVIETIRDISDVAEVPVVLLGREWVPGKLRRHRQLWTRITSRVEFGPASERDVRLCSEKLCEVALEDTVLKRLAAESEGHIREIIKGIGNLERIAARAKAKKVTAEMVEGKAICHEWQRAGRPKSDPATNHKEAK